MRNAKVASGVKEGVLEEDLGFVHRYIPAEGGSKRVLLLLHGTGADESNLIPVGRALDGNAALLSPRGKVLEDGKLRWFRRLGESLFDEADVARRAHELADFVIAAARRVRDRSRENRRRGVLEWSQHRGRDDVASAESDTGCNFVSSHGWTD